MNSFLYIGIDLPTDELLQVIISKSFSDKQINIFEPMIGGLITNAEHWTFDYKHSEELILRQFNTQSLTGLGLSECNASIEALGSLIYYVKKSSL